jgi:hypothetical protein
MFARMAAEGRLLGFDLGDWSVLLVGLVLTGFLGLSTAERCVARGVIPHLVGGIEVAQLSDRILEILRSCPCGLTAKEVAEQLGATSGNISSRLSKLAAYGVIEKTRGGVPVSSIYNVPTSSRSPQGLTTAP